MKIDKLRFLKSALMFLLLLSLSGCAYFNMFFNGRKHFEKGEETYRTEERINPSDYENSLHELSKILEFYPDNSIVPDALLMMGKCYYRLGDNIKAKRKYQELITNYKESDLVQEAKLRLVEVAISEQAFDQANAMISEIKMDQVDLEAFELKRLLGDLSLAKNDTIQAFKYFSEAALSTANKKWQRIFLKKAAELAEKSRNYRQASDYYLKMSELAEDRKNRYDNSLLYAEMLEKAGVADSAFAIYEQLQADEEYESFSFGAQLRVGRWYFHQKKYPEAFAKLDEILRVLEKKPENTTIMAEAAFWLGEYYLKDKQDLVNAGLMYDSAKALNGDKERDFGKTNLRRIKTLTDYKQHSYFCSSYNFMQDSLNRQIAELNKNLKEADPVKDSLKAKNYKQELMTRYKDFKKLHLDFVKKEYQLGDLFSNDLQLPDSALFHYQKIINRTDQPYYASRAMHSLATMPQIKNTPRRDSLLDSLLQLYPSSMPSNYVRELKGLPKISIVEDSAAYFFNLASDAVLTGNYALADEYYNQALKQNEDSPLQPLVRQAAAQINEIHLNRPEIAKEHYQVLKSNYPQTKEGNLAINKLRLPSEIIKTAASASTNATENKPVEKKLSEDEKWFLMDRRNK